MLVIILMVILVVTVMVLVLMVNVAPMISVMIMVTIVKKIIHMIRQFFLSSLLFAAIRYLSTPIYVMVSQWDSYQLKELIHQKYHAVHLPPSSHHEKLYLVKFGNNTHRSIRKVRRLLLRLFSQSNPKAPGTTAFAPKYRTDITEALMSLR